MKSLIIKSLLLLAMFSMNTVCNAYILDFANRLDNTYTPHLHTKKKLHEDLLFQAYDLDNKRCYPDEHKNGPAILKYGENLLLKVAQKDADCKSLSKIIITNKYDTDPYQGGFLLGECGNGWMRPIFQVMVIAFLDPVFDPDGRLSIPGRMSIVELPTNFECNPKITPYRMTFPK